MSSTSRRTSRIAGCLITALFPLVSNAAPPLAPDDFRYDIYSDTAAELFWDRTTNVPVAGYEITKNGEELGVFDALSYFDDTLERGIDYVYTITAVGVDGERSGTSTVFLRTPRAEDDIAMLQRTVRAQQREISALRAELSRDDRARLPPKTGQRTSERPGDDGDLQAGASLPDPRLVLGVEAMDDLNANGVCDGDETCNGTVTDKLTGLVWLQDANCFGELGWFDAVDVPRTLAGDGSSECDLTDNSEVGDWRLPNVREIQSLMDYGNAFPDPLLPEGHPFVDVQIAGITSPPASYWTSTSTGPGGNGAYTVSMAVGWVERLATSGDSGFTRFVWPVRNAD